VTKRLFMALMGLSESNAERVIALFQRDNIIWSRPFLENGTRLYTLTTHGARELGLDWRKFRRAPSAQAIQAGLLSAAFCAQEGHTLLTDDEFAEMMPAQAACRGKFSRRYFVDRTRDSLPSVLVLDFGARASRIATRARREVELRRQHAPWLKFIRREAIQIVVATPFGPMKAARIAEELHGFGTPHAVVAVRGLEDLFLGGIKK
jgi:hypothetical protein